MFSLKHPSFFLTFLLVFYESMKKPSLLDIIKINLILKWTKQNNKKLLTINMKISF